MLDHSCQVQRHALSERRDDLYETPPVAVAAGHELGSERIPAIERLRRLMEPDVTLERAWHETNHPWRAEGRAAESTVAALMLGLRERGIAALQEPKVLQRLSQLDDQQLRDVAVRLQKLMPHIATAWTPEDVAVLFAVRGKIHGQKNP